MKYCKERVFDVEQQVGELDMKAILTEKSGGPEVLYLGEVPEPRFNDDEILVKVRAAGVNRADILQRKGTYPPPPDESPIIGLEMAGIVEKVGAAVDEYTAGDQVFSIVPGGGYAEKVALPASWAMPIPQNISLEEAAAIAEVYLTAYLNLFWIGSIDEGNSVLIHAGASGVGTAAIQLASLVGAKSIVTVGSQAKLDHCLSLGANFGTLHQEGPFASKVLNWTQDFGVDMILDCVGASYWKQNLASISADGKIIVIGAMGGGELEKIPLWELIRRRISIIGSSLRSRSSENKARLCKEFKDTMLPKFIDGTLSPVVDEVFSWNRIGEAHKYLEENRNIGKVVLKISDA